MTCKARQTKFIPKYKERSAPRLKNVGYSRFFSPFHLDPAFILPETPTREVISAIESSSISNSTAMPGKNNLYESPVTDEPEGFYWEEKPGANPLIYSAEMQKCCSPHPFLGSRYVLLGLSIWIMRGIFKKPERDVKPSSRHKQNVRRGKLTISSGLSAATSS